MITCLIIDDEPNALKLLEDHIQKVPYLQLKQKCFDAFEASHFLQKGQVDLIFLDINMPQMSGMELAATLSPSQLIVFTTAYSSYALDAYEFNAIDYLLKPITFKRFMLAINKATFYFSHLNHKAVSEESSISADYMFIKSGKQVVKIEYKNILYFEAVKEYINIISVGGQTLVYKRMKQLETQLPSHFVRIHNSYIINLNHLDKIIDNHVLIGKARLPVSAGYKEAVFRFIENRML